MTDQFDSDTMGWSMALAKEHRELLRRLPGAGERA